MSANPYAPPLSHVDDAEVVAPLLPPFFSVSIRKFTVMWVCTMGLYQLVWFFIHWQRIKVREGLNISPGPRAVFSLFFAYSCFKRIRDFEAPGVGKSTLAIGAITFAWFATACLSSLPAPFNAISWISFLFLLPVQRRANEINRIVAPDHDPNERFTIWNWFFIVIGSILGLLTIIGAFLPPQS